MITVILLGEQTHVSARQSLIPFDFEKRHYFNFSQIALHTTN